MSIGKENFNEPYDEVIIEPANRFGINMRELWQYRELFYFFTWRDIKVKYKQTLLGVLWVMLQPLLMMLVFTFFFRSVVNGDSLGMPYGVFVFSGVLLWTFFSSGVTNGGNSMLLNAPIIKKIFFPRLIIPICSILAALVDLAVTLVLFVLYLVVVQPAVDILSLILFWPLALLLSITAAVGLGCGLSALMVKYRDFRFVIPFAMQLAFFLTPIVYPLSSSVKIPYLKYIFALNPMYGAITMFRIPMMSTPADPVLILISVFSSLCMLFIGLNYFKRTELYFADLA
jgi:lipopolysaccharide transport system permease protein